MTTLQRINYMERELQKIKRGAIDILLELDRLRAEAQHREAMTPATTVDRVSRELAKHPASPPPMVLMYGNEAVKLDGKEFA